MEAMLNVAVMAARRGGDTLFRNLNKLEKHNPSKRRTLSITRLVAGAPAAEMLKNGDMILAIDDEIVTTFLLNIEPVEFVEIANECVPTATGSHDCHIKHCFHVMIPPV